MAVAQWIPRDYKPRIKRAGGLWTCSNHDTYGFGVTPSDAFSDFKRRVFARDVQEAKRMRDEVRRRYDEAFPPRPTYIGTPWPNLQWPNNTGTPPSFPYDITCKAH